MTDAATFHKVSYGVPMRYTDSEIIDLWLQSQSSPATMDCYRRDAERLLGEVRKPLNRIGLARISHGDFLVETKFDDGPVFHRPWWSAIAGVRISG